MDQGLLGGALLVAGAVSMKAFDHFILQKNRVPQNGTKARLDSLEGGISDVKGLIQAMRDEVKEEIKDTRHALRTELGDRLNVLDLRVTRDIDKLAERLTYVEHNFQRRDAE